MLSSWRPGESPQFAFGVASQLPPLPPFPLALTSSWPGRDLCAYAKHTVCLKTGVQRAKRWPLFGVDSSFFSWQRHAKGCSSSCFCCYPSSLYPCCIASLSGQVFACFGIFPTRFCLFSKLKLIWFLLFCWHRLQPVCLFAFLPPPPAPSFTSVSCWSIVLALGLAWHLVISGLAF